MDYRFETADTAREFHRKRRAFIILNGELLFLPRGSEWSHYEFCERLGIDKEKFCRLTRGYYLDGIVCFYNDNFGYDERVMREAEELLMEIAMHVGNERFKVYLGVLPNDGFKPDRLFYQYVCGALI